MNTTRALIVVVTSLVAGCFGARTTQRSYFVLHGQVEEAPDTSKTMEPLFPGLVRVRNLDAEDAYDKFQIVVRRSPYELRYSDSNVWAVKPYQMVSDIIARRFVEIGTFSSSTRELGETRPEFTLGGELHAIEVYDANDIWYAHLALSLTLIRFSTGERIWNFTYDDRKLVSSASFSHAVRALSELLDEAILRGSRELESIAKTKATVVPTGTPTEERTQEKDGEAQPIYVPESR